MSPGWQVRPDLAEAQLFAKRYGVTDLPDIKIFHYGRPADYQAGAVTLTLTQP